MKVRKNIAISDSGFLFNPSTGDSFSMNPIGHEILQMIQDEKSEMDIIDEITANYAIDKNTVEKDLYDFINMLKTHKLIE